MTDYSESMLAGVGLIAVNWAKIENELKLHTSALAAQETDGLPIHDLEIGFKRLRKFWLAKIKQFLPDRYQRAKAIADKLIGLSNERAIALHGKWESTNKRGYYEVIVLRQNRTMDLGNIMATPKLLRHIADRIADAHAELRAITRL